MTEAEWVEATDPTPMLEFLRGKASDRKRRLFACSCCRRLVGLLPDERRGAQALFDSELATHVMKGRVWYDSF